MQNFEKLIIFVVFSALFFAFTSCASTKTDLSSYNPIAIMTVYSNNSVPWYDENNSNKQSDDGILTGAVNRAINKKNPVLETAQERIDVAAELLSRRMRATGLSVIDPSVLQDCTSYKNAGKNLFDYLGNTIPANGYDSLTSSSGKLNRAMCNETNAKSVLYVNFVFQKTYVKDGVHNKGVAARVVMKVYGTSAEGKTIIHQEYSAVSNEYTPIVKSSQWNKEELCSYFPTVINTVITQFLNDYMPFGEISEEEATPIRLPKAKENIGESVTEKSKPIGAYEEKISLARKLIEKGMSDEEVSELTELPIETVQSLHE